MEPFFDKLAELRRGVAAAMKLAMEHRPSGRITKSNPHYDVCERAQQALTAHWDTLK
jgi:hypothetical protein